MVGAIGIDPYDVNAARGSFQLLGYLSFRRLCPIVFKKVSTKSGGAVAPGRCSLFPPSTSADALAGRRQQSGSRFARVYY
jgi:hypothetical protein